MRANPKDTLVEVLVFRLNHSAKVSGCHDVKRPYEITYNNTTSDDVEYFFRLVDLGYQGHGLQY